MSIKLDLTPIDEPNVSLDLQPIEDLPENSIPVSKQDDSLRNLLAEDVRQFKTPDKPIVTDAIKEVAKAGERYPAGAMKTLENFQIGEGSLNPLENIFTPTPDSRDAMTIALDMGKRILPEAKIEDPNNPVEYWSTVGKEFVKQLPFSIAGATAEIANPINALLGGVIAKTPHVEIPAPVWVDNAISSFIKNFHAPLSGLNEAAKSKLTNAITDEIYTKIEPRMDELKSNFKEIYGREASNDDIKNLIRSKLDEGGLQQRNVIEQGLMLAKSKLAQPLAPIVEAPKRIENGVKDVVDIKASEPSVPSNEIVPFPEAQQHGKVVGIDAKTKLPIIDTNLKGVTDVKKEEVQQDKEVLSKTPSEEVSPDVKLDLQPIEDVSPITIEDLNKSGEPIPDDKLENAQKLIDGMNKIQEDLGISLKRGEEFIAKGQKPFNSAFRSQEKQDAMIKELLPNGEKRYPTATPITIHSQGLAVDIPTKSLKIDQQKLAESAHKAGFLVEDISKTPDHVHIEIPSEHSQLEKSGLLMKFKDSQKDIVSKSIEKNPKSIKEIAEETKILEPNIRRILGVGTKEGKFERVDKGVYILKKGGKDVAYVIPGDSIEVLPRLAKEGFKADMVFLDIPYNTVAVRGGNRGVKYNLISVDQFKKVVESAKEIAKDENAPIIYMYSQAKSGLKDMQKYTSVLIDNGFKPVAKGEYTKLQQDGITQVRNMRGDVIVPEGIIVFNQSGKFEPKTDGDFNFKLIRPKGYQTEKPVEMLKKMIEMTTKEGDVILDPFAGSGSTLKAAVEKGRVGVGIEISDKAIEEHIKPKLEGKMSSAMASPKPTVKPNPENFAKKVEQLTKFAQGQAILRKGANLKTAAGLFLPIPQKGEVKITQESLKDDATYMAVLAHELGHAIEFNVVGKNNDRSLKMFGDGLSRKEIADLYRELRDVTREIAPGGLEGNLKVGDKYGAEYFNRPTELIARFFEKMLVSPGNLEKVAPTAVQLLEKQAVRHPIIAEFIEAAQGSIDKGELKNIPLRDLRETFQKYLGKRAGQRAYGDMVAHKAMVERGKIVIENFLNDKFKDVKDAPENLFRSAESIKISKGGVPEFGTRRYSTARNPEDEARFIALGMKKMPMPIEEDGMVYPQYAQYIYTPEQGKAYFEALSPEGKKLILDFTAQRSEAKDFFNREMIRETYKVEANLEGWVHHYFEDTGSVTVGGNKLKYKTAGSRKQRTGAEGYVENFKKAMQKALVDLESEREFNIFIKRFFARVTKPLADGAKPDQGWVEVEGSLASGVGTSFERKVTIVENGKSFKPRYTKYQMPKPIYERYKLLKGLVEEASDAMKIVNDINRYWRINILAHPATAMTNFVSGGIQYSAKILNDFYKEVLTGNVSMPKTKKNVSAMLKVLSPKGWNSAPDWVYGGDLSNFYGEFMGKPTITSGAVDAYADKALKLFSFMERYWKKVISLSEDARTLEGLNKMTPEGLKLPTDMERELLAQIEQATDIYAYNYDNIPLALEQWRKNAGLNAVKPFLIYPYKNMKQVYGMVSKAFDRTLPWQDRVASLMALTMIVAMYAYFSQKRKELQKTPEATVDIPARLQTRGRLFMSTDEKGKELFVRVSKYPFLNLSEAGLQFVNGHWEDGNEIVSNMLGSVGPVGQLGMLAMNFRNKYQTYTPAPVILGDSLASFMPLGRILEDVSRYFDLYQRKQEQFSQSFTKMIPTTDEVLQEKLHGKVRTERVPIENGLNSIEGQTGTFTKQGRRTTIDVPLENYKDDILLAMLSGVYVSRIDPKIVEAFITRKEKNNEKKAIKEGKALDLRPTR